MTVDSILGFKNWKRLDLINCVQRYRTINIVIIMVRLGPHNLISKYFLILIFCLQNRPRVSRNTRPQPSTLFRSRSQNSQAHHFPFIIHYHSRNILKVNKYTFFPPEILSPLFHLNPFNCIIHILANLTVLSFSLYLHPYIILLLARSPKQTPNTLHLKLTTLPITRIDRILPTGI